MSRPTSAICSFCGKPQSTVQKIIAGPNAYICNECVDLCNDIISEQLIEAGAAEAPPSPASLAAPSLAASLEIVQRQMQALTNQLRRLAEKAGKDLPI